MHWFVLALLLASAPSPVSPESPDAAAVQAALDRFAQAWLAGDRPALERSLHEDYVYVRGSGEDRTSWDRDAEIRMAVQMAERDAVESLTLEVSSVERTARDRLTVFARLVSRVSPADGEALEAARTMVFLLVRNDEGGLRILRQSDVAPWTPPSE